MDNIYLFMLVALAVLAVLDIVVGVSNDAINFLNSAIGSKVISLRTIMIVASLGIFIGAIFSSGMMEVARKGIFNPGEFYFDEIMIIFMAVILTDILLLDFFNTLGLPTSTTVSIVFNLLGASVVMSIFKIISSDSQTLADIGTYINTDKALTIISGILLSVVISFSVGALVQWVSRIIFTFQFEKKIKNFGALFGGIALTSITYFIFIKGLKGTPYYSDLSGLLKNNEFPIDSKNRCEIQSRCTISNMQMSEKIRLLGGPGRGSHGSIWAPIIHVSVPVCKFALECTYRI